MSSIQRSWGKPLGKEMLQKSQTNAKAPELKWKDGENGFLTKISKQQTGIDSSVKFFKIEILKLRFIVKTPACFWKGMSFSFWKCML